MELQNFLRDLQEYKELKKGAREILTLDFMIEDVMETIEEIRLDHIEGDIDDQER